MAGKKGMCMKRTKQSNLSSSGKEYTYLDFMIVYNGSRFYLRRNNISLDKWEVWDYIASGKVNWKDLLCNKDKSIYHEKNKRNRS